ncbi:MAG: histidine kinase [Dehalococcoidia bacterium]|nr:histidine kinase [Dehalococcoidia bacterium]MDD5495197.1 histidine kinase [Dehalococcoidia bacterium]
MIDKPVKGKYHDLSMDEMLSLARNLVNVQEDERRIIARELHDRIGQSLTVLKLLLNEAMNLPSDKAGATLGEAQSLVNELMSLVRYLSLELRPKMLDDLGLLPALLYLFESYTSHTHINVRFEHYGLHRKFPPEIGIAAYRIVQEALNNVALHAGVSEVKVLAWSDRKVLFIRIEDLGKGFNLTGANNNNGLNNIQGRAMLVEGKLTVQSAPGKGTVINAELPVITRIRKETAGKSDDNRNTGR